MTIEKINQQVPDKFFIAFNIECCAEKVHIYGSRFNNYFAFDAISLLRIYKSKREKKITFYFKNCCISLIIDGTQRSTHVVIYTEA
jgi:hypothetical protein